MTDDRQMPGRIHVGTAGWSYPDWKGQVYPKLQPRGFDPLRYLAQSFDAVEVNSTFYRIPDPTMTRRWVQCVADHPPFRFTAKLWQGFTHEGQATAQAEAAFRNALAPLHEAGRPEAAILPFPQRFPHTPAHPAPPQRPAAAVGGDPPGL